MDCFQILTLISDIVLAIFTGGLVFATVCLWRSTSRYTEATKKLYDLNSLVFLHQFADNVFRVGRGQEVATLLDEMIGGEHADKMRAEALIGYNRLFRKVLDDAFELDNVFKEFPPSVNQ